MASTGACFGHVACVDGGILRTPTALAATSFFLFLFLLPRGYVPKPISFLKIVFSSGRTYRPLQILRKGILTNSSPVFDFHILGLQFRQALWVGRHWDYSMRKGSHDYNQHCWNPFVMASHSWWSRGDALYFKKPLFEIASIQNGLQFRQAPWVGAINFVFITVASLSLVLSRFRLPLFLFSVFNTYW